MPAVVIRTEVDGARPVLVRDDETLLITDPLSWRWVAEVEDDEQGRALIQLLCRRPVMRDVRVRGRGRVAPTPAHPRPAEGAAGTAP